MRHSGMVRRTRPGISRFRVRAIARPGMTVDDYDSAACTFGIGACFGPHRVSTTLVLESTPSITIELAASTKKLPAVASWLDSHQPPTAMKISRAVCASTGPITFAAPCDEKYI